MYDYIKGIFTYKSSTSKGSFLTIENNGIGYLAEVTARDCAEIEKTGIEGKMYIVLLHREDKMSLCGFLRKEDRDIFSILTVFNFYAYDGVKSLSSMFLFALFLASASALINYKCYKNKEMVIIESEK